MIDSKRELFRWGPSDGHVLFIDEWMEHFSAFKTTFKVSWPDVFVYLHNGKVTCIADNDHLISKGKEVYSQLITNEKKRKRAYEYWQAAAEYHELILHQADSAFLKKLDDDQLSHLFHLYDFVHKQFWAYGYIPELVNWGIEDELKRAISKKYPNHAIEILEALTAPEDLSFFQEEGPSGVSKYLGKCFVLGDCMRKRNASIPIFPSPMQACRSTFDPRSFCESFK